jgi:hypothetical protein
MAFDTPNDPQADTQNLPVDGQPQSVPAVAPPQAAPAAPPPGGSFRHLAPALIGAVLGVAGPAPTRYGTDANGRTVALPAAPETTSDKIRRIANHALVGLAASGNAPQQKSGLANALAGAGEGANAVGQEQQTQDKAARAKAQEDFETEQRTKLQKHNILVSNAAMLTTHFHNLRQENDLDPQRSQNKNLASQLEDAGVNVRYLTDDEAKELGTKDPNFVTSHILLPIGFKPVTDEKGNVVTDENGTPQDQGQIAVIDGLHDGKIPMPASVVDDVKQYGKLAGMKNYDGLKAGDEVDMKGFVHLFSAIQQAKKKEAEGWVKYQTVFGGDDGKTPMQYNPVTNDTREFPDGVVPNVTYKPGESAAKIKKDESTANKNKAEANKAGGTADRAKDRLALQQAAKSADLAMKAAQAELNAANKNFDDAGIKAAQQKLQAASDQFNQATSKLAKQDIQVGHSVTLKNGQTVTVTKVNPDGTFEYKK